MHKPYTEFTFAAYSSFCNSVPCTVLNKPYTVFTLSAIGNTPAKYRSKAQLLNTRFYNPDFCLHREDNFRTINCFLALKNQLTQLNHKKNEQQKRLHRKIVRAFLNICNYLPRGNIFSSGSLTYCFMKGATLK